MGTVTDELPARLVFAGDAGLRAQYSGSLLPAGVRGVAVPAPGPCDGNRSPEHRRGSPAPRLTVELPGGRWSHMAACKQWTVDRRDFLAAAGTAGVVGVAGCGSEAVDRPPFRVGPDGFERLVEGEYRGFSVRGVNLGMAKPGRFPGEAAVTRPEYDRWLSAIGDVANVVRTYTIHPPAFYRALRAYNETATDPLLLLQGTWVTTADLLAAGDASAVSGAVDAELRRTVDVVHGATTLPERPGHAAGQYDADVSDSVLGFLFGIEWPPDVVAETNSRGPAGQDAGGTYLRSDGGAPFERWLAGRLDGVVSHEMTGYGAQRPVAFVNWPTTDPLEHPYEPFVNEDRVSVDPDRIRATVAFDAGTFAAYHVYPYYPDFLNETPEYVTYEDHRGEPNNYAGYLNDLAGHTDHPLLVAEFGVPSSRGIAHRNVHGRHQGRHTEREQGEILAAMFEDIAHADTAGGVAFAWQNEWFKRTWNLDARSVPGRRPYWSNIETPEQRFGLLGFEPVDSVRLDGSRDGWDDAQVVEPDSAADHPARTLTELRLTHDVEGLYFRLAFERLPDPVDWAEMNALVAVGLTGRVTPLPFGTRAQATADFVVRLAGPDSSRLLVDSRYDAFAREFGEEAGLPLEAYRDGAAGFVPVREPLNRGYTVPATGEDVPFDAVETGQLRYGNGNPASAAYDSLTDVHVDPEANVVEGRVPWVLLNVADPSSKRRIATDWERGLETVPFDGVTVGAATFRPQSDGSGQAAGVDGVTNLAHQVPSRTGPVIQPTTYAWERWNQPAYDERLKESYYVLRDRLP
jgi:hypothetical protein